MVSSFNQSRPGLPELNRTTRSVEERKSSTSTSLFRKYCRYHLISYFRYYSRSFGYLPTLPHRNIWYFQRGRLTIDNRRRFRAVAIASHPIANPGVFINPLIDSPKSITARQRKVLSPRSSDFLESFTISFRVRRWTSTPRMRSFLEWQKEVSSWVSNTVDFGSRNHVSWKPNRE